MNLISKDPEGYGIDRKSGQILTNFNKPIAGSSISQSLKYMTGQIESPPKGHSFLLKKLNKDSEVIKFFPDLSYEEQSGEGLGRLMRKRIVNGKKEIVWVKNKPLSMSGLLQEIPKNLFKPVLWERL